MTSCLAFSREQIRADRAAREASGEPRRVRGVADSFDIYGHLEKRCQKALECDTHYDLDNLIVRTIQPKDNHFSFNGKYDAEAVSSGFAYKGTFNGEADLVDNQLKLIFLQYEGPQTGGNVKRLCLH